MIHFITWLAHWYMWLLIVLCKLEWWLLHCRLFIAAGLSYDAVRFTVWPQLHRAWWLRRRLDEPC